MLEKLLKKISIDQPILKVIDAYTMTRYGMGMDKETLKRRIIERVCDLIKTKACQGYYSLVYDLDENLPDLNNELVDYYSSLGFNCFILDSSISDKIETTQLYLSWKTKNL